MYTTNYRNPFLSFLILKRQNVVAILVATATKLGFSSEVSVCISAWEAILW
jgi:hypothetical protein